MPELNQIQINDTTYDIADSAARQQNTVQDGEISQLKSAINHISNVEPIDILTGTYTGTQNLHVYENIPAGTYHLHIGNISSADTDATTCRLLFTNTASSVDILTLQLSRGVVIDQDITLGSDVEHIIFYASDNYPRGANDTFTFSNVAISAYYPLMNQVEEVEKLEYKSVLDNTYSGTKLIGIDVDIKAGKYVVDVSSITSSDTDANTCLVSFQYAQTGSYDAFFNRGNNIQQAIELANDVNKIYLYASDTNAHSANDTFSFDSFKVLWNYPLKDSIDEITRTNDMIKNLSPDVVYSADTISGGASLTIFKNVPAGKYIVTVENVTSTDTDSTTCELLFGISDSAMVGSIQLERTAGEYPLTLSSDASRIIFHSADTYLHSVGDTFEITGFKIESFIALFEKLDDLEYSIDDTDAKLDDVEDSINGIAETYVDGTYSGTRRVDMYVDFPVGDYAIQVDNIVTDDVNGKTSSLIFLDSNNAIVCQIQLLRGVSQFRHVHLSTAAKRLFVYAAEGYPSSEGDSIQVVNLKITKVNSRLFNENTIPTPVGFRWQDHPLNGHLFRTEKGIECDLDVSSFKPTGGTTYWVAPNGSDSNTGKDSLHPLQSIRTAMLKNDVGMVIVKDGFYDVSLAPQHINGLSRSVAVLADSDAHPVISSNSGAHTFTLTTGYSNTYETAVDSNCVWDIENAMPYKRVLSVASVESEAATYYCDGTKTYVHTYDGNAPTSNIRCCPATDNFKVTASGAITIYIEGLTICGGNDGAFVIVSDGSVRPYAYAKNCFFAGTVEGASCRFKGCESIVQGCEACESNADGFSIVNVSSVTPRAIEIDCIGHHNGIAGDYNNDNGSTAHSGGSIIRVNGKYYNNKGPNVGDVHDNTESWNLGCRAWSSFAASGYANTDFIISDGVAKMWLDNCSGYGSEHSLYVNNQSTAYVRGNGFVSMDVSVGGHMESY